MVENFINCMFDYRQKKEISAMNLSRIINNILVSILFGCASTSVIAGEWEKPWSSVKEAAVQRCSATFPDYQLQAVCMDNEKEGYDKMQGDFGLPADVAEKVKQRCESTFQDFQLQAVCMENEREGYEKMKSY